MHSKAYNKENYEKNKARYQEYYQKNKEVILIKQTDNHKNNREEYLRYQKEYYYRVKKEKIKKVKIQDVLNQLEQLKEDLQK